MTRGRIGVLVTALVILASGCDVGTDDEMAPQPTRTVTATPSQSIAPAPATIPVGQGDISPSDVVWSQGSVLHVGDRQVDLAPVEVDAFVVVQGGVFVLGGGELWFTDLARLRGTAQTEITDVQVTAAADRLEVVDERSGQPMSQSYDTRTGKAIPGEITPRTRADRLGDPVGVTVAERLTLVDPGSGIPGRQGPGRYGLATAPGQVPVPFDADGPSRVPLRDLPARFRLEGWSGSDVFYGLDVTGGGPRAVVSCDVPESRCTPIGRVSGSEPVVFANPQ